MNHQMVNSLMQQGCSKDDAMQKVSWDEANARAAAHKSLQDQITDLRKRIEVLENTVPRQAKL